VYNYFKWLLNPKHYTVKELYPDVYIIWDQWQKQAWGGIETRNKHMAKRLSADLNQEARNLKGQ